VAETPPDRLAAWWPWIVVPALIVAIAVVGYRSETTARALKLVDNDVTALELKMEALKSARAAQSPLRLPPPTESRTAKARPPEGGGSKAKAKAPPEGAQARSKAGKAAAGATAAKGAKTKAGKAGKAKAP
jgi:hypothetical protein